MRNDLDRLMRDGAPHGAKSRLQHGLGFAGEGDDGAVVVGIRLRFQQRHAGYAAHGAQDLIYYPVAPALAEVRDRLYELRNATSGTTRRLPHAYRGTRSMRLIA